MITTDESYRETDDKYSISTSQPSIHCELLQFENVTNPAQSSDLISDEMELFIYRIKSSVCIPLLFLVGFPANCVNMIIFVKQGIKERINLCLFSLSVVDLFVVFFVFIVNSDMMNFANTERFGLVYRFLVDTSMIGFYGFIHGSMVLSTIISCERCFCIVFPLQSQHFLKTKTMTFVIIFCVSIVSLFRFVGGAAKYKTVCVIDPRTNYKFYKLGATQFYLMNKNVMDIIETAVFGLGISVGCPVVVFMATIITALKLRQTVIWRKNACSVVSGKELAVTKMLVYLSVQFVVLSIPVIFSRLTPFFVPELNGAGQYKNLFQVTIHVIEVCADTNASLNFFVYYFTGTKYRQTLKTLLRFSKRSVEKVQ